MKTQHIKFEILNERLSLFNSNLKQLNFALNMLFIDQICNANLMTARMTSQEMCMFATGKLVNQLNQILCDLTGLMIYISGYKQTWSDIIFATVKTKNVIFQLYFSEPIFAVNLER